MAKKLRHEMRYDATPEEVFAMLATVEFREQVCEYQRFPKRTVTITPEGEGMSVTVDQHRPADEVPTFARKLVGDEINIVQEEQWSSQTSARLQVSIPGKPGEMRGSVALRGDADGTTEHVEVEIKVHVPLIGGKIEGFIADMLLRALKAEHKVGRRWLAGE